MMKFLSLLLVISMLCRCATSAPGLQPIEGQALVPALTAQELVERSGCANENRQIQCTVDLTVLPPAAPITDNETLVSKLGMAIDGYKTIGLLLPTEIQTGTVVTVDLSAAESCPIDGASFSIKYHNGTQVHGTSEQPASGTVHCPGHGTQCTAKFAVTASQQDMTSHGHKHPLHKKRWVAVVCVALLLVV